MSNNNNKTSVPEAKEAMNRFGSDKPDLRFGMELVDVSETVKDTEFVVFKGALENGGLTSRQNGSVGGYMVKKMIEAQEKQMAGK